MRRAAGDNKPNPEAQARGTRFLALALGWYPKSEGNEVASSPASGWYPKTCPSPTRVHSLLMSLSTRRLRTYVGSPPTTYNNTDLRCQPRPPRRFPRGASSA